MNLGGNLEKKSWFEFRHICDHLVTTIYTPFKLVFFFLFNDSVRKYVHLLDVLVFNCFTSNDLFYWCAEEEFFRPFLKKKKKKKKKVTIAILKTWISVTRFFLLFDHLLSDLWMIKLLRVT